MALELLMHYRKEISEFKLVPSDGGCFEVSVNKELVFSKLKEDRFPGPEELRELIEG